MTEDYRNDRLAWNPGEEIDIEEYDDGERLVAAVGDTVYCLDTDTGEKTNVAERDEEITSLALYEDRVIDGVIEPKMEGSSIYHAVVRETASDDTVDKMRQTSRTMKFFEIISEFEVISGGDTLYGVLTGESRSRDTDEGDAISMWTAIVDFGRTEVIYKDLPHSTYGGKAAVHDGELYYANKGTGLVNVSENTVIVDSIGDKVNLLTSVGGDLFYGDSEATLYNALTGEEKTFDDSDALPGFRPVYEMEEHRGKRYVVFPPGGKEDEVVIADFDTEQAVTSIETVGRAIYDFSLQTHNDELLAAENHAIGGRILRPLQDSEEERTLWSFDDHIHDIQLVPNDSWVKLVRQGE